MSAERLQDLFSEAVEASPEERARILAAARDEDPDLAVELERLLAHPATDPSPIDRPLRRPPSSFEPPPAPERVGPYRILETIGRGGMGTVYLAEQRTPDFSRTVALKLIDHSDPSESSVRRFRDEVRILAALEHGGIARFLDGGLSPEGLWFLALEYVAGDDLVTHAERRALGTRERVVLFLQVVHAVAYAHGRGVIHRDLKPGNVLVGADGRPRLLDFGISKLFDPEVASLGAGSTRSGLALTPAYASPEQLDGRRATPLSDIYSLGAVLYELLSGRRPPPGGSGSRSGAAGDVEPPSVAARRTQVTTAPTARRRDSKRATPAAAPRIARDLDAICLRALRSDPAERYPTAQALADDLARYLDRRPVSAREPGLWGRLARRLVGRK